MCHGVSVAVTSVPLSVPPPSDILEEFQLSNRCSSWLTWLSFSPHVDTPTRPHAHNLGLWLCLLGAKSSATLVNESPCLGGGTGLLAMDVLHPHQPKKAKARVQATKTDCLAGRSTRRSTTGGRTQPRRPDCLVHQGPPCFPSDTACTARPG